MNIILNHTLRSIKDNRAQIFLIITTIALVTIMIFVALSMTGLFYNININARSRLAENMDISLNGELFSKAKVEDYVRENDDKIDSANYYLQLAGLVQTEKDTKIVMLEATDFKKMHDKYAHKLKAKQVANTAFEYPAVWIGEDFAKELNVNAGDTIQVYYQSGTVMEKFSISRIMFNQGFFADTSVNNILVDSKSINTRGMINLAHIRLKDAADYEKVSQGIKEFMKNDAIIIEGAIDYERVEEIVESNTKLLNIALVFIMTIMILILFTSYLVIAKNRLNEMIIFKAAGATPLQTTLIMLSEVLLYGIIGAAIGLAFGRIGMGIITKALIPNFPNAVTYNLWKFVVAFFTGIIVSVISALLPILRISKKSIREMSSGIVKDVKYAKPIIIIVVTIMLAISLALLLIYHSLILPLTIVLIALFAFWIYLVIPYVIRWLSLVFSRIKGQSSLASISIKRNASTNTLTTLVAAVITFSFIVVSVISLIITAITPYNTRYSSDYVINSTEKMDYQQIVAELSTINGIKEIAYYKNAVFELPQNDQKPLAYNVVGINSFQALEYATKGMSQEQLNSFNNISHPVVLNNDMAIRLGLGIGDTLSISRPNSTASVTYEEKLDYEFTVVGIDYTSSEYDRVVYIKLEDLVYKGIAVEFSDEKIFIQANEDSDKQDVYLSVRDKLSASPNLFVLKFEDWVFATAKGLSGVSILLKIIQILFSIVAFVGVINLSIVAFTDRKNEFSVYKTSGMSIKKYNKLALFEGLIISISGGIIGTILSFFFNSLMPSFAGIINKYLVFKMFPLEIPIISLVGVIVYVLLYSMIALSNNKNYSRFNFYNQRNL